MGKIIHLENYDDLPEIKSKSRSMHIMRNISVSMIQANNGDPTHMENEETLKRLLAYLVNSEINLLRM
tara:strand:- start:1245 stop:1448 length:204 start_codon:yes stop_codon:yes gene_type:complete